MKATVVRWTEAHNEATGQLVLGRVRVCHAFLCRLRGLTFRHSLTDDVGLLFVGATENRVETAIHMFFVFFPIAVVWLNGRGCVVDSRLAKPFRPFYAPSAPARDILEGPPALLDRVHKGDQLRFEE